MNKVVVILLSLLLLTSCAPTEEELKSEIEVLADQRNSIRAEVKAGQAALEELEAAREELDIIKHQLSGGKVQYVLTLKLKQEHMGLDFEKMMKDSMNQVEFDLAVDEDVYEDYDIGDRLLDEFRKGSAYMEGSYGSWVIEVIDKEIKKVK